MCIGSLSLMIAVGWGLASGQTPRPIRNDTVVVKMDAALDAIVPADAKLEMLPAEGFEGGEGPVWVQDGKAGYLLFSDIPGNRIVAHPVLWTQHCSCCYGLKVLPPGLGRRAVPQLSNQPLLVVLLDEISHR